MSICRAFLPSLWWKAFATFTSHTVFLLFFPVGAISLQQDVAAATRVPTWAFPSEVLDRRVVQWNLGLSGRIVPTSAPTLSWLSVGVAPAAKLTAAILRASRSDFAREPKTHFSVLCFIQEKWSHFAWLHFTHVHMSECWKYCKPVKETPSDFYLRFNLGGLFLSSLQSRNTTTVLFYFSKFLFFFRRPFALPWLWSNVSPLNTVAAGKSQQTPGSQVHIQGSKRLCESPSGVVPSAALMSAGVNTCWELVPDRHVNVTFKESIREWEEKCDFLSFEAANLWPSVVITTPNVSLRLLHPMSVFLLF